MGLVSFLHLKNVGSLVLVIVPMAEKEHVCKRRVLGYSFLILLSGDSCHCLPTFESFEAQLVSDSKLRIILRNKILLH